MLLSFSPGGRGYAAVRPLRHAQVISHFSLSGGLSLQTRAEICPAENTKPGSTLKLQRNLGKEAKGGVSAADKPDAATLRAGHLRRFCSDNGV